MKANNLDSRLRGNDTGGSGNDTGARATTQGKAAMIRRKARPGQKDRCTGGCDIGVAPQSKEELHAYVKKHLGLDVPRVSMCSGHSAPMDYLWHAYSADFAELTEALRAEESADCIVWAGRGGRQDTACGGCDAVGQYL